jgi:hypothetical protein
LVVEFNPTRICFYPSPVKFNDYGNHWQTVPCGTYLFAGTYDFRFGSDVVPVTVGGCAMTKARLMVLDENVNGVPGGKATPACGGSWQPTVPGATDATGVLFADIPACTTKIRMQVGNSSQEQTNAQLDTSNYTWQTEILRVYLKDHAANPIADQAGSLAQGGGTWIELGNFNASGYVDVQTFPVASARYKATYNCTSETKDGIPVTAGAGIQELDFQTGQVFGACITQYQGCGWSAFVDGMELMPGTRTYRYPAQTVAITAGSVTNLSCP